MCNREKANNYGMEVFHIFLILVINRIGELDVSAALTTVKKTLGVFVDVT
jgi:hypothetical protein